MNISEVHTVDHSQYLNIYETRTRLYRNNTIYGGNPRDYGLVFGMWACYVVLSLYFFILVSPYFWIDYSSAITIIGIVLSLPGIYNAIKCLLTDPGVLKKNTFIKEDDPEANPNPKEVETNNLNHKMQHESPSKVDGVNHQNERNPESNINSQQQSEKKDQLDQQLTDSKLKNTLHEQLAGTQQQQQHTQDIQLGDLVKQSPLPLSVEANIDAQVVNENAIKQYPSKPYTLKAGDLFSERYCTTCKLKRPPLASHCAHCNNCIKEYDHHCFFMGNCIGERNMLNFFLFLFFTSIWTLYMFIFSLISFIDNVQVYGYVFEVFYSTLPLFILFVVFVGGALLLSICDALDELKKFLYSIALLLIIFTYFWIAINNDVVYYRNPIISMTDAIIMCGAFFLVAPRMFYTGFLICIGSNLKQQAYKAKHQLSQDYKFTCMKGIKSFCILMFKTHTESEILNS